MNLLRVAVFLGCIAASLEGAQPAEKSPPVRPDGAAATGSPARDAISSAADSPASSLVTVPAADVETIKRDLSALQELVAGLQKAVVENAAPSDERAFDEIRSELAQVRESIQRLPTNDPVARESRVAEMQKTLAQNSEGLKRIERLVAPPDPDAMAGPDDARLGMIFAGVAAALALGAIVSVIVMRPGAGLTRATHSLDRRITDLKEALAQARASESATASEKASNQNSASTMAAKAALESSLAALQGAAQQTAREHDTLAATVQRLESVGADLPAAVETLLARAQDLERDKAALEQQRRKLDEERAALAAEAAERAAATKQGGDGTGDAALAAGTQAQARLADYDRLWPEPFRAGGPLADWKEKLVAAVAAGDATAGVLYGALVRWHVLRSAPQRDRDRWIEATDALGRACHGFLAAQPHASDAETLELLQTWTRAFKTPFEEAFPSLKLNAVYPGDRFDTDRMEAVGSSSGGRQTVQRPLSWFILEKSGEATHVLRRAQVVTS